MPDELATLARPGAAVLDDVPPRARGVLWRQPGLLLGVGAVALAAVAMTSMMTAGPIAGMAMGHSEGQAALAVQLHMVGMFAPGFVVARWIGRVGERRIAALGALLLAAAGAAAAASTQTWAFLAAMTLVGVGWNLASSGGSALVTAAYRPSERGRVATGRRAHDDDGAGRRLAQRRGARHRPGLARPRAGGASSRSVAAAATLSRRRPHDRPS